MSGLRKAERKLADAAEQKLLIPSNGTAFQIKSIEANIARNKNGEPEQVLILNTTADISSSELAKAIQIRLLPKREAEKTEESDSGSSNSGSADQSDETDENRQSAESEEDESMTRRNPIMRRNGKVRPMCRTMCSSKPGELNSRSFPRKGHRIDNMLLRYASNRKASSTFVSQKECALSVIIL